MDDAWVCGNCKSINRARERRCYSCHRERDDDPGSGGSERRTIEAVANRTVRDYLPTWPLALLAGALLIAVAILGIVILVRSADEFPALRDAFVAAIYTGGQGLESGILATQSAGTAFLGLLRSGLVLLALVSFAAWLALATMNVPALGGGVPSRNPLRVFIYTLIPIWNLFTVPRMVQDVLYRLDAQAGGAWMVLAATIGLLGSWLVSFVGSWVIVAAGVGDMLGAPDREAMVEAFARIMDQGFWLSVVTELMIAVGTLLLVVLMGRVEQRCAARNREVSDALAGLAGNPAAAAAIATPGAPWPAAPVQPVEAPPAMAPGGTEVPVPGLTPAPARPTGLHYPGKRPGDLPAPPTASRPPPAGGAPANTLPVDPLPVDPLPVDPRSSDAPPPPPPLLLRPPELRAPSPKDPHVDPLRDR